MRWRGRRSSSNIEDRRGASPAGFGGLGGLGRSGGRGGLFRLLPVLLRFLGVKGTAVVVMGFLAYSYFSGGFPDLSGVSNNSLAPAGNTAPGTAGLNESAEEKALSEFVAVVLADTEDTWHAIFKSHGQQYKEPKLVLFRDAVNTACGRGQADMGPFYCPADQKIYLDLHFFNELRDRHDAPGDFAQAYVIAHEVAHHVQTLLGISKRVQHKKQSLDEVRANRLTVKQELQADCYAGIWAHNADRSRELLEVGDIEEGLTAASAIGDDRLQKEALGYVRPESFTHGSSAQRVRWFKTGLQKGSVEACDTFAQL